MSEERDFKQEKQNFKDLNIYYKYKLLKGFFMVVTAKDLRFNINMLFDVLNKGEDITIIYRGKPKAKLISTDKNISQEVDSLFGLWKDRDESVDNMVREMRQGRDFGL
jgi:antitoxin (DNA-binding transcriptional repressor) of toxin-antitoxin stability system